jgi:hypothetical protein
MTRAGNQALSREEEKMDARSKLNAAHVNGALIVAGIVGGLAGHGWYSA